MFASKNSEYKAQKEVNTNLSKQIKSHEVMFTKAAEKQ